MKTKHIILILLCGSLILLSGCKKSKSHSLAGSAERPSWVASPDRDYSSSMTAIVKVDLGLTYPDFVGGDGLSTVGEGDLLAAFCGGECVGVTEPVDGLFFLYISLPEVAGDSTSTTGGQIILRYYSSALQNLFQASDTFDFQSDARLGTVSNPLIPSFFLMD